MARVGGIVQSGGKDDPTRYAMMAEYAVAGVGQGPSDLAHEGRIGMWRGPYEMHAAGRQLNDKRRIVRDQAARGPHFGGKEVGGGDGPPVGGEKRTPRHRSLGYRTQAVRLEDRTRFSVFR